MKHTDPFLEAANRSIREGETQKAQSLLMSMLANDPNNVEALLLLSRTFEQLQPVAACLRRILSIDPNHPEARELYTDLRDTLELEPSRVMYVTLASAAMGRFCPYCQNQFRPQERVIDCPTCHRIHHYECWMENGFLCAASLCEGFTLEEIVADPLPAQPPSPPQQVIVIRREDIKTTEVVTRQQQEKGFLKKLLLVRLIAEEGGTDVDGLPDIDDLIDQLHRDRITPSNQAVQTNLAQRPTPPAATSNVPASSNDLCTNCGSTFPQPQSKFCVKCGQKRSQH